MKRITALIGLGAIIACWSAVTLATNGYAPHGVGLRAKGMGGAGIAYPQDAIVGGVNPAGMALVGDRIDLGVDLFRPRREARISGTAFGGFSDGTFDGDGDEMFLIPEFGISDAYSEDTTLGLSVFGNGGMNTAYDRPIPLFGSTPVAIDLAQLFVVPTLSHRVAPNHYVGIGVNLAVQRINVRGAQNFAAAPPSIDPANVTNNGYDYSYGAGIRIGWLGKVTDKVWLGATAQTRTYMTEYDDYRGFLAEQGDFDIPANFGLGIAIEVSPQLDVALDVMHIMYSEVDSVGNPISKLPTGGIGSDGGAGFGWDDQTIWKLGVAYRPTPKLTLRAGWNYGESPIQPSETAFNIFAPATVEHHLTLGMSWRIDDDSEITVAYMHAFENEIKGSGSMAFAAPGGLGEADLEMYQDSIGVAFTWYR